MSLTKVSFPMIEGKQGNILASGASSDASALVNQTAIELALSTNASVVVPEGTFTTDAVAMPESTALSGYNIGSEIAGQIIIKTGNKVTNLNIATTGTTDAVITSEDAIDGVLVDNCDITSDTGFAVNLDSTRNVDGLKNAIVKNSKLTSVNYGVLSNSGTPGGTFGLNGRNLRVQDNLIEVQASDAIEINHPVATFQNFIVTGNFLANTDVSGSAIGFGVGVAAAEQGVITNNIVWDSRLEAIHLEDSQKGIVVANNFLKSRLDGVKVGNHPDALPPIVSSNQIMAGTPSTNVGVYMFYDAASSMAGAPIVGNVIQGFESGVRLGATNNGPKVQIVDNNSIIDCTSALKTTGMKLNAGALRQFGTNYAKGCTNLFEVTDGHYAFGKIVSETAGAVIIKGPAAGYGGFLPARCDGFGMPYADFNTINGTFGYILFALPGVCYGRVKFICKRSGLSDHFHVSATIKWDGTTFTATDYLFTSGSASITNATFGRSGAGNLVVNVTATAVVAMNGGNWVEFDGEYWDA